MKMKNNPEGRFGFGMFMTVISIIASMLSFISEDAKITGYAVNEGFGGAESAANLMYLKEFKLLSTLSPGNYYIDGNGLVYLMADGEEILIAKISQIDDIQKNVYVDKGGNIGFMLEIIENEQK